jgi:hypothetical protein
LALRVAGILPLLKAVHTNLDECKRRIAELVEETGRRGEVVRSHPGIGVIVSAVILAEAHDLIGNGDLGRFRDSGGSGTRDKAERQEQRYEHETGPQSPPAVGVRQWAFTASRCDPYAKARGLAHERALRRAWGPASCKAHGHLTGRQDI